MNGSGSSCSSFDCACGAAQREIPNKKRQRHSGLWERVAVLQLAFEQMIDFVANGMQIIEAEIHNGIADVCYLVHFL
jgi:hypothetical protein